MLGTTPLVDLDRYRHLYGSVSRPSEAINALFTRDCDQTYHSKYPSYAFHLWSLGDSELLTPALQKAVPTN